MFELAEAGQLLIAPHIDDREQSRVQPEQVVLSA